MDKKTRVVISGYYGFDNTGDEAILFAIINMLKANIKSIEIIVLSNDPESTALAYKVKAVNRFNPHSIINAIKSCDLLISGGGSLLQDVTSLKTIPYYLFIAQLGILFRKKVVFYSQGIGPVNHIINKHLIRYIANKVNYIFVRDKKSKLFLESMAIKTNIEISPDPVFALKLDHTLTFQIKKEIRYKKTVGIYIRPWKNQAQIIKVITQISAYLLSLDYKIYFISMQPIQDTQIARQIATSLKNNNITVIERPLTISETLAFTANFEFIIGMRLHSLIMAIIANTPAIALSYDPKIENIMNELHIDHQIKIEDISFSALKLHVDYVIENLESERNKLIDLIDIKDIQKPIHYIRKLLLDY
ncbi:MAG: polysaccharide pyruvyl transferase CsaB [Candidatus Epulonipiscioides saccharophilum]|nr:MAG: polysaccharide pyruvyl transferase CsaB [Epulopiscium sp. AS2M-Bin001]